MLLDFLSPKAHWCHISISPKVHIKTWPRKNNPWIPHHFKGISVCAWVEFFYQIKNNKWMHDFPIFVKKIQFKKENACDSICFENKYIFGRWSLRMLNWTIHIVLPLPWKRAFSLMWSSNQRVAERFVDILEIFDICWSL